MYIKKSRNYFKGTYIKKCDREKLISIGMCMYCGGNELLEVDHIYPKSLGGSSDFKNLTTACSKCNQQKGNLTMENFLERIFFKRNKVFNSVFRYTLELKRHKRRGTKLELQEVVKNQILKCRTLHSYYTRIINSILTEKYRVNG